MTIRIEPSSEAEESLWRTTLEVSRLFAGWPWVLIGAQAVVLLARELGRDVGRATRDVDVVVDLRVLAGGAREAASRLVEAGFEPSAEHDHRFERGSDQVDLLAPDHLGARADLTTIPPRTTTEIPGATRALSTRHAVAVDAAGAGEGIVFVPSLAGMLVLKVAAWQGRRAERDLEDLVRLLDLVPDAGELRSQLKPAERRRLAAIDALADQRHLAWRVAQDPEDARAALARIGADP
jgi:predicted nucleotidyltransferase